MYRPEPNTKSIYNHKTKLKKQSGTSSDIDKVEA